MQKDKMLQLIHTLFVIAENEACIASSCAAFTLAKIENNSLHAKITDIDTFKQYTMMLADCSMSEAEQALNRAASLHHALTNKGIATAYDVTTVSQQQAFIDDIAK